jgi:methionyl-tRNA formyltransferase
VTTRLSDQLIGVSAAQRVRIAGQDGVMSLRVVFMGTPEFSVPMLAAIIAAGHHVVAAYSQPPRPAGRGNQERKSPVQVYAEAAGIPVHTPNSLRNAEAQATFRAHNADVAVVVAYGLILPTAVLAAPVKGCLNMHASALPRWRGAAPIQRAIMAGDASTAAIVMQMEEGLDTGAVCLTEAVPIGPDVTAGQLHDELSQRGAGLMVRALAALADGGLPGQPQSTTGVTYAAKIEKAEARIDFARSATDVHNHVRGLAPFPGAWFEVGQERIKVLRTAVEAVGGIAVPATATPGTVLPTMDGLVIACGSGALRLVELQRAGKKPMLAAELLRGFVLQVGTRLG